MYKVLIADDERMVRLNLRTLIERDSEGFTVVGEAKDGEHAYQMSLELKPDLLITDIRMPGMDGLELIRSLSSRKTESEFLVVSGYGDFEYAQSALRCGVADYLLKPIDPDYFVTAMRKILTRLYQKNDKRSMSKDWMWSWKIHAERTAKSVWHLNETELGIELERIRGVLTSEPGTTTLELVKRFDYYMVVLNGELKEMNQSGLPLPILCVPEEPFDHLELYDALSRSLIGLVEHIRASRNWWSYNRMIKSVTTFIDENYLKADLSLKDVAAHFELSPNYFGITFKRETGVSFNQYLTQLRMEKAKSFLQNPFVKVYEAGEAVGFEDYAYFSKTFKKYTGMSPSDYRKSVCLDASPEPYENLQAFVDYSMLTGKSTFYNQK